MGRSESQNNLTKHGVSFLTAAEIFANEILERIDVRGRLWRSALDCSR
jgi:uncharacterized DUF497 family protein